MDYEAVTLLVNCFDPHTINDGVGYVAVLEKTLLTPGPNDFYVKWYGDTDFGYDANGTCKWESSIKDHTLYADFQWRDGFATDCLITFLAPDGTPLKLWDINKADPANGSAGGYNVEDSMLRDMWIDNENVIHFKVKEKYDPMKENNSFIMRVYCVSTAMSYDVFKEITFHKDGDQGTQGSDWMAPIWPTNHRSIDGITQFVQPLECPSPIVIKMQTTGTDAGLYKQVYGTTDEPNRYKLYLRPFVSKNG